MGGAPSSRGAVLAAMMPTPDCRCVQKLHSVEGMMERLFNIVERFGLDALIQIRDGGAMNRYQWAALYQQRPSPLGGGIFKRDDWRFYNHPPSHFDEVLQSWDCAFKDKSSSDYVVGQVWGRKGADKFLLDQVRGHLSFSATIAALRTLSTKWPDAHRKLVEDKANGTAVIDTLKHEISGIIAVEAEGGKEARAHAVSSEVEAHNVYSIAQLGTGQPRKINLGYRGG